MRDFRRFRLFLCVVPTLLLMLTSACGLSAQDPVVFVFGGDIEHSRSQRPPSVLYSIDDPNQYGQLRNPTDEVIGDWPLVPYLNEGESKAYVESLGIQNLSSRPGGPIWNPKRVRTAPPSITQNPKYIAERSELPVNPLQGLAPALQGANLALFNLEGALSDRGRKNGIVSPEKLAQHIKSMGGTVVSLANNHTFDAQEQGFRDTLRAVESAGLLHVGGGLDLDEARKPVIFEKNGIKIGILGYAQFSNWGESAFASYGLPGIAPMDPFVMKADIRKLRPQVDYVVVTMHWATNSGTIKVAPANRKFAYDLIDAGADMILGHHPPHPKGIEVYKGKVIIYAPSIVLRGRSVGGRDEIRLPEELDAYLVRFTIGAKSVQRVEVLPIATKGQMPFPLEGARARQLLEGVRTRSAELGTTMTIDGDKGVITIPAATSTSN